MKQTTLGIIIQGDKILLCMKKRGFGQGLLNGPGGKQKDGENLIQTIIRETKEETGLDITENDFEKTGLLHFFFEENQDRNQDVHLFLIKNFHGEEEETEEMKPMWFNIKEIPYDKMREDDYIRMPKVLEGESVEYNFYFDENGKLSNYEDLINN